MNTYTIEPVCSVYPGKFVPSHKEEETIKKLISSNMHSSKLYYVKTKEQADAYKVEVEVYMPCLEREEFIVLADANFLLISATQNKHALHKAGNFQCSVILPADADTELTVAEYKNSILHFYIPKTKQPFKHSVTRIVVY
ncbi:MAG: Hsp20/alpha crystallin family protein [Parafilimonas sp.]